MVYVGVQIIALATALYVLIIFGIIREWLGTTNQTMKIIQAGRVLRSNLEELNDLKFFCSVYMQT